MVEDRVLSLLPRLGQLDVMRSRKLRCGCGRRSNSDGAAFLFLLRLLFSLCLFVNAYLPLASSRLFRAPLLPNQKGRNLADVARYRHSKGAQLAVVDQSDLGRRLHRHHCRVWWWRRPSLDQLETIVRSCNPNNTP